MWWRQNAINFLYEAWKSQSALNVTEWKGATSKNLPFVFHGRKSCRFDTTLRLMNDDRNLISIMTALRI